MVGLLATLATKEIIFALVAGVAIDCIIILLVAFFHDRYGHEVK